MTGPLRTALIGFGKMGHGYAADPVMARHYRYAAHAQVLAEHPKFEWVAAVDPDPAALASAPKQWGVSIAGNVAELADAANIDVAVIATPPESRLAILDALPGLRAVLVEKPLGTSLDAARDFLDACASRDILVQVNLWRRADERFRELAEGGLEALIGTPQAAIGYYGNGLLNNGTHGIDFARMLFGDVESVQRLGGQPAFVEGPIRGDDNPAFALAMRSGLTVTFHPLRFANYRENGMSIWGARGRLDILNEGLVIHRFPAQDNRAMQGEREVAADAPASLESTVGVALYRMYDNLADALENGSPLWSAGASALRTSAVVEAVRHAPADGRRVTADACA